jgi:hypothetical protein
MDTFFNNHFRKIVIGICLSYLCLQFVYVFRLPLVMDEFDGAYDVYRLKTQLPYLNFKPYKTVLGYYVQLPPLLIARDVWNGLMMIKSEMVLINTAMMLLGAFWLGRFFRRSAVVLALLALAAMSTYLERSSALRVDMMTAWAGFISLLFLLSKKGKWSGFFAGISFLISQKGICYIAASNCALLIHFLWSRRQKETLYRLGLFNLSTLVPVALYFAFWGILGSFSMTGQATFLSHHDIIFEKIYDFRFRYWMQTLIRNPFFYIMAMFGLGFLFHRSIFRQSSSHESGHSPDQSRILLLYGIAIFVWGLWYRQPWPYFFVSLMPTFFVLVVAFFEDYLPNATSWRHFFSRPAIIMFIAFGLVYPLSRIIVVLGRDSGYQQHMVQLAGALIEDDEYYISGVDVLYDREEANARLRRLNRTRRQKLQLASPEYMQGIISELETSTPKFVLTNYRTARLPDLLKDYVERNYAPFWGSIYLYAPEIQANGSEVSIKFDGVYQIEVAEEEAITINGQEYKHNNSTFLKSGVYRYHSPRAFRLRLIPENILQMADDKYKAERKFYPDVYAY